VDQIISISTIAYCGYDLETALEQISKIGDGYVELDAIEGISEHFEPSDFQDGSFKKKISTMMKGLHLSSIAFSGHMDLSREGIVPTFEKRMRFAKEFDIKIINTFSGPLERIDLFYKNIKSIEQLAKSKNLIVALETHGDIISDKSSIGVLERINSENVKINYDFVNTFHAAKGRIDLEEDFRSMLPYIAHIHLKDTIFERDRWHFTQIGKGIIDYRGIFKELRNSRKKIPMCVELPFTLEVEETGVTKKILASLKIDQINKTIRDSISFVRELWESV